MANGNVELSVKQVRLINLGLRVAVFIFAIFNDPEARAGARDSGVNQERCRGLLFFLRCVCVCVFPVLYVLFFLCVL